MTQRPTVNTTLPSLGASVEFRVRLPIRREPSGIALRYAGTTRPSAAFQWMVSNHVFGKIPQQTLWYDTRFITYRVVVFQSIILYIHTYTINYYCCCGSCLHIKSRSYLSIQHSSTSICPYYAFFFCFFSASCPCFPTLYDF